MARQVNGFVGSYSTIEELTSKFPPVDYVGCFANVGNSPTNKAVCNGTVWSEIQTSVTGAGIDPAAAFSQRFSGTTVAGAIGDGWQLLGPNALLPATDGRLIDGKFTTDTAGTVVYATRDLGRPVNWMGAKFGWDSDSGGAGLTTVAFLITPTQAAPGLIANSAIHITATRSQLAVGYIRGQVITDVSVVTFPSNLSIGTDHIGDFAIDGNFLRYSVAGIVGSVKMPVMSVIGLGNFATWELFHGSSANADRAYIKEVWAGARAPSRQTLNDLCVAAWNMEATSWLDSSGQGLTLTGNATPTVTTGKHGNAVSLVGASSQFLSRVNAHQVEFGKADWTLVMWVNPTALPSGGNFLGLLQKASSTECELHAYVNSSGQVLVVASPSGSSSTGTVTVTSTDTLTAGVWSMVTISYLNRDTRLRVTINNGTAVAGVVSAIFAGGTQDLRLGRNGIVSVYWNGLIDSVALFKSPPGHGGWLDADMRAVLWADGAGRPHPF